MPVAHGLRDDLAEKDGQKRAQQEADEPASDVCEQNRLQRDDCDVARHDGAQQQIAALPDRNDGGCVPALLGGARLAHDLELVRVQA